jgi:hypothetical protein
MEVDKLEASSDGNREAAFLKVPKLERTEVHGLGVYCLDVVVFQSCGSIAG